VNGLTRGVRTVKNSEKGRVLNSGKKMRKEEILNPRNAQGDDPTLFLALPVMINIHGI